MVSTAGRTVAGHTKRADIQGLRALAVVAVVINHLTGHLVGGFVGVDVFFVISGYLITSMLVREFDKSGGISIGGFYRRRVRRLFPAAFAVTAVTIAASSHVLSADYYHRTWQDGLWASAFWANWHFVAVGTNYFTASLPPSPFQHYWSLSVEEQFYVVWPLLLLGSGLLAVALSRLLKRSETHARDVGGIVAVLVFGGASLAFAFQQSSTAPVSAYFSTLTRAWELGLGALLAFVTPRIRAGVASATAMTLAGTAAIVISLFTTTSTQFPAPGALLPCLGAALVIASLGAGYNPLLENPPAVFIGDISYSVYLVHFPVIILVAVEMPGRSSYFYGVVLLLTAALSLALYAGVERPVLESSWLAPRGRTTVRDYSSPKVLLTTAAFALIAGYAVAVYWPGTKVADNQLYAQVNAAAPVAATASSVPGSSQAALAAQIAVALRATSYPALNPTIDAELAGPTATAKAFQCARLQLGSASACTWGDSSAAHTIYLVGDSTSMVYAQALGAMAEQLTGWKLRFAGAAGCRFLSVQFQEDTASNPSGCAAHNQAVVADIKHVRPDVLVVTNLSEHGKLVSGRVVSESEGIGYLTAELDKIKGAYGKSVWLANPPLSALPKCYTPGSAPIACVSKPPAGWVSDQSTRQHAAAQYHAIYVSSEAWFCTPAGYCPAFVGSVPTFHSQTHATSAYMAMIWPAMQQAMTDQGVFKVQG